MNINPKQYGLDVINGKIKVCDLAKLSVQRHFDDLEKDWEYYFDEKEGGKPVRFFETLQHFKGEWAGSNFIPSPWQAWVLYVVFGWKRKSGGRRFRYMYIEVPRKNGKTTFVAAISLFHLLLDNENAPEIYTAATTRDQAAICLDTARGIANHTSYLKNYLTVRQYDILRVKTEGKMKALAANKDKLDGLNPSMAIFDEVHEYKDWKLVDVITSATGSRSNYIIAMITTAGFNRNYPAYDYRKHCIDVLKGINDQDNLYSIIYTLDEGDDWKDPEVWKKCNPNLGDSISYDYMAERANEAILRKEEETNFKTKHLNIWTDASEVWVKDDDWMMARHEEVDLEGAECWGGLDIAASVDINALVLMFKKEGVYHIKPYFWIPERKVREKEDRVNYWKWKEEGLINIMPGDALDDEYMARDLLDIFAKYRIRGIAFDRYYAGGVISRLEKGGFPIGKMHAYGQGYLSMSGPIRELERRIYLRSINHMGNPVLRWMCSNISISMDAAGNVKFDKSKSTDKIDGMVALAMAVAMEMNEEEKEEFTGKITIL
jgi:phage terminase large subunit-like protein